MNINTLFTCSAQVCLTTSIEVLYCGSKIIAVLRWKIILFIFYFFEPFRRFPHYLCNYAGVEVVRVRFPVSLSIGNDLFLTLVVIWIETWLQNIVEWFRASLWCIMVAGLVTIQTLNWFKIGDYVRISIKALKYKRI